VSYDPAVQQPLRGSLEDKLQQLADMIQVVADDESATRRRLTDLRRSPEYGAAYDDPEPLVSVVIATYRSYETLRDVALPSVLNGSYQNVEIVVVGDCAPDETAEVIRQVGDPRVRYENLPMRGPYPDDPARAWLASGTPPYNAGVAAARGRWIAPLGDDDAFLADHIEQLLADARERRLELVYGRLRAHHPDGSEVLVGEFPPRIGEFGMQGALYHAGLQFIGLELSDTVFDLPNDWSLCRRMMRAGVRIGMVDAVVTDYYPSADWDRRQRAPEPDVQPQPVAEPEPEPESAAIVGAAELETARTQVAALEARARELEHRLAVIATSTSWRVTRPLRDAAAWLRRR
jgi:Glycosyl transferase family 2